MVIGQVAGILHGSTELTGDLDLLWSGNPNEAPAMGAAFAAAGAQLMDDNGHSLPSGVKAFDLPKVQFRSAAVAGDCCTPALRWGGSSECIRRAQRGFDADDPPRRSGTRVRSSPGDPVGDMYDALQDLLDSRPACTRIPAPRADIAATLAAVRGALSERGIEW